MAAPPRARDGKPAASAGRPIVAGVSSFLRPLSARATDADLWAALEVLAVEDEGLDRLERLHGVNLDRAARKRYTAFIGQARQYFQATKSIEPIAKPLLGYYFALNLTKAYLTAVDPASTAGRLQHGLAEDLKQKTRYYFQQEGFKIKDRGVFRLLATRSGQGFCYANNHRLRVVDLLPYLADGYDLYGDIAEAAPKLLPVLDAFVWFGNKEGWLRVEVDRNVLTQRNISPESLLKRARIFGKQFKLVQTEMLSASYESKDACTYSQRRSDVLDDLAHDFDKSLFAVQRNVTGGRRYIVLSDRNQLLSHEAVTFALLHHLSNMVRYRPADVERLRGSAYFWLFASWVDRACENFLLALASRISREEHLVV
jgi:hypothetical protein